MGSIGKKIVKADIKKIITQLNKALADEWLAYYQYWIGAKVVQGPMRAIAIQELNEHAQEELDHAVLLTERIIQLGGTPLLSPKEWFTKTNCGYAMPEKGFDVKSILKQNIKGEQCAIKVYQKIIDFTHNKDIITYNLASKILEDEVKHEEDLETILNDVEIFIKKISSKR